MVESRSTSQTLAAITGSTCAIVLIVVGADPLPTLRDLALITEGGSSTLVMLIDSQDRPEVRRLALELGADQTISRLVPPPAVANWLSRWIELAAGRIAREGWTRAPAADPARASSIWIEELVPASPPIAPEGPAREASARGF